ncbi:hypothetical protein [Streptomyces sp. NPDC051132]|uniref:hypothetical protein n=1 Tax=unclassified Streptomyces TaxID=2593676 RepID=UPI003449697D
MVRVALHVLESALALTALYGVALVYVPAAFILGGLAGVVAVERALARPPSTPSKERRS